MLEFSCTGIFKPLHAIRQSNPTVFKVTVFPPVFGPVISKLENLSPKVTVIGTTLEASIKGCLADSRLIIFSSLILGVIPFISLEYFALAKIKSNLLIKRALSFNSSQ